MKRLPAALRPNPHAIDDHVMVAIEKGWTVTQLAEASYAKDRNPSPAFVVTNIRNLSQMSPVQTRAATTQELGHIKCHEHPGCEICRCTGTPVHHEPTTMPDQIREQLSLLDLGIGRVK
jgi:hypothetical protein